MLYEDNTALYGSNTGPQYNGNLSGMIWKSGAANKEGYGFTYDNLNRLTASDYRLHNGSAWTNPAAFEEKSITYDKNGNIRTLLRTNSTGGTLNSFQYNYTGNRLQYIGCFENDL